MKEQISRAALQKMYEEMRVADMAEELNLSFAGLYKLLDDACIDRKRGDRGSRQSRTAYEIVE